MWVEGESLNWRKEEWRDFVVKCNIGRIESEVWRRNLKEFYKLIRVGKKYGAV